MKSSIEQSVKEKLKVLAKERETSFAHLWRNLILERFLTRLSRSSYRDQFILKGGTLLAKYLPLGRETKDLDFTLPLSCATGSGVRTIRRIRKNLNELNLLPFCESCMFQILMRSFIAGAIKELMA